MSAQYEILPPGGHETMLEAVFNKIKSKLPNDENVKQKNYSTYNEYYRILFSGSADDTEHTEEVGKSTYLRYNPWAGRLELSGDSIFGVHSSNSTGTHLEIYNYDISLLNNTWDGTHTSLKDTITYLNSQSAANKVDKAGDTMTGTLLRTTADGAAWHSARDHAFIRSHGFANNGSWFPALSFLTTGGSWAIGSLSNSNNFWFSYTRNNEYTKNINKTDNYQLVPVNDGNAHTYTIAHSGNVGTGDSNGQIKIAGTNVSVKGLGSRAYDSTSYLPLKGGTLTGSLTVKSLIYSVANGKTVTIGSQNNSWCHIYTDAPAFAFNHTIISTSGDIGSTTYKFGGCHANQVYAYQYLRGTYITRIDTGDSGYVNHVNYNNSAYTPVRASGFVTMSCKHTKTNVVDISEEDALKLLDIRPVNFDYVEEVGGQKDQIGVLAEDTYDVLPKVVSVPDDYVEEDFDISKGIQQPLPSVDYAKFVPYLIKMVQIQQKEINELKTSLRALV